MAKRHRRPLAKIRRLRGRTQEDLADFLGLNRGYIERLEVGYYKRHKISHTALRRLVWFYGNSVREWISDVRQPKHRTH